MKISPFSWRCRRGLSSRSRARPEAGAAGVAAEALAGGVALVDAPRDAGVAAGVAQRQRRIQLATLPLVLCTCQNKNKQTIFSPSLCSKELFFFPLFQLHGRQTHTYIHHTLVHTQHQTYTPTNMPPNTKQKGKPTVYSYSH